MDETTGITRVHDPNDGSTQITTPNGRYYTKADSSHKFISITTVLDIVDKSSWYIPWVLKKVKEVFELTGDLDYALSAFRRENKAICDRGSRVHDWIECWLNGEAEPQTEDQDQKFIDAFIEKFWWEYEVETISTEQRLFKELWYSEDEYSIKYTMRLCEDELVDSKFYGYAGTYDFYGKVNGLYTILDWKTSGSIHDSYWMQLAAEVEAADFPVEQVGIVRMKPETKSPRAEIVFRKTEELGPYWERFKHRLLVAHDERRV